MSFFQKDRYYVTGKSYNCRWPVRPQKANVHIKPQSECHFVCELRKALQYARWQSRPAGTAAMTTHEVQTMLRPLKRKGTYGGWPARISNLDVFHVTRLDSYTEIVVSEFIVFKESMYTRWI